MKAVVSTVVVLVEEQTVFVTLAALLGPDTLYTAALFGLLLPLLVVPVMLLYSVQVVPSVLAPTQEAYWSQTAMQFWIVAGPVRRMPAG